MQLLKNLISVQGKGISLLFTNVSGGTATKEIIVVNSAKAADAAVTTSFEEEPVPSHISLLLVHLL